MRGIGDATHLTEEYVILNLFINGKTSQGPATACLRREAHIVDNLKAKLLIGVDILAPEEMVLDFTIRTLTIGSCQGLVTPIRLTPRTND